MLATTYRRQLRNRALDQYGYITTRDAVALGVPPVELRKLTQRGGLDHITYGLYRFDDVPPAGRDQYMEAVLRVGPDAHLTHDAVLALHDLGLVNPPRIKVGTARRVRSRCPEHLEIIQQTLESRDLMVYEGIPSMTVARALLDWGRSAMTERLQLATEEAERRGLVTRTDAAHILTEIGTPRDPQAAP